MTSVYEQELVNNIHRKAQELFDACSVASEYGLSVELEIHAYNMINSSPVPVVVPAVRKITEIPPFKARKADE